MRKSRNDSQFESVEDVLKRHETQIQEFMMRTYGQPIPNDCIYREIVSGETIDGRPMMIQLLNEIEQGEVEAVVVIEPQRLTRGSLAEIGRLCDTLQYSNTKVITPMRTFDLTNKYDRKAFEQELMRGNEYLEYVKEILDRGRQKSVNDGLYIGSVLPFGYDKVKLKKGNTLTPNKDSDIVRYIFNYYLEGNGTGTVAQHLNELGIQSATKRQWTINMVRNILTNEVYAGYLTYGKNKNIKTMVNGEIVKKRKRTDNYIRVKGIHEPIIPLEIFEETQLMLRSKVNRPIKSNTKAVNALAGILKCKKCGRTMLYKYDARNRPALRCMTYGCPTVSSKFDLVEQRVLEILAKELQDYKYYVANFENEHKNNTILYQKQLKSIEKEISQLEKDLQNALINYNRKIIDENEHIFLRNYSKSEIDRLNNSKKLLNDKLEIDQTSQKKSAIPILSKCIEKYPTLDVPEKQKILSAIIERIDYSKDVKKGDFTLEIFMKI